MLEKLFTSKNRIKILEFLLFNKEESYLREISRKLRISPSAVKREIDNLESMDLISRNGNRVRIDNKNIVVSDLKNIFIKTDFIFYPIKKLFENEKDITFAMIFGSFAEGKYTSESDIDLFIIGNIKLSRCYSMIKSFESQVKREINPVVWTIENLKKEKNSGFIKDIFKKKKIILKGDLDELQKSIR